MKQQCCAIMAAFAALSASSEARALEKPNTTYSVFQFPLDKIPRIDGKIDDWAMVPDSYTIGTDQLKEDTGKYQGPTPKTGSYDVRQLCAFKLMPLEPQFRKSLDANWTHSVVDMDRRLVAFKDESVGKIDSWHWDFGDGSSSDEQHPLHAYEKPGNYVVVLDIAGPSGTSRFSKVWDIQLR
jgi:PKD domain